MSSADTRIVPLPDAALEVEIRGNGEPLVMIQTALAADEFLPLADELHRRNDLQVIRYHRRGYMGSSPVVGPGSIARDAADCERLLTTLDVGPAHVVGVSYSGAIALELAASAPDSVHSLCVIEPPPVHVPSADEFFAANAELMSAYRRLGPSVALDQFMTLVVGSDWRGEIERRVAGGVAQIERDVDTFFATDIPALLAWRFGSADAKRINQPVLYVGGTNSGSWFAEVRDLVLAWLPQAENVMVAGADHSLVLTHADRIAETMTSFLKRHPVGA